MSGIVEDAFQWLASWVAVDKNDHGNGGRSGGGGGTVRATDLKDAIRRDTRSALHDFDLWKMGASASFVRLAGVSGALAIGFGAYGAHGKPDLPSARGKAVHRRFCFRNPRKSGYPTGTSFGKSGGLRMGGPWPELSIELVLIDAIWGAWTSFASVRTIFMNEVVVAVW